MYVQYLTLCRMKANFDVNPLLASHLLLLANQHDCTTSNPVSLTKYCPFAPGGPDFSIWSFTSSDLRQQRPLMQASTYELLLYFCLTTYSYLGRAKSLPRYCVCESLLVTVLFNTEVTLIHGFPTLIKLHTDTFIKDILIFKRNYDILPLKKLYFW